MSGNREYTFNKDFLQHKRYNPDTHISAGI